MRICAAALKVWSGVLALLWATAAVAAPAGTASLAPPNTLPGVTSATVPSIDIARQQSGLAGTCGGSGFDVSTSINVGSQASADVRLTAPGLGIIEEFTDETGKNIGPYSAKYPAFHILAFGGGLAPNTHITLTITTYTGPSLSGSVNFTSSVVFDCTTGAIFGGPAIGESVPIPALSPLALIATMALLVLLGAGALRRATRRRVR